MFCPKCGAESRGDAGFCWKCGAPMPAAPDEAPSAGEAAQPKRLQLLVPRALKADQYDHPLDRSALAQVRKLAPVVTLVKLMIQNWDEPMVRANLLGQSVRVGPNQFADIHAIVRECAEILDIPEPDVFIKQDPYFNAMTFGVSRPFIILHSSLVDAFSPDELRSVIGHEMGHIKSQHVLYLSAVFFLTQQAARLAQMLFGIGALVAMPARAALTNWQRQAEFTADRAGIICVQDVNICIKSMAKLVLGSRQLADRLNLPDFMQQGDQANNYARLVEGLQDHPLVGNRVREMGVFFTSDQYRSIFAAARQLGAAPEETGGEADGAGIGAPVVEADRGELAAAAVRRGLVVLNEQGLTPRGILSHISGDARELEQAMNEFELASVLDPEGENGIAGSFYSGVALIYLGQIKQARAVLEELRKRHPSHDLARQASDVLRRLA